MSGATGNAGNMVAKYNGDGQLSWRTDPSGLANYHYNNLGQADQVGDFEKAVGATVRHESISVERAAAESLACSRAFPPATTSVRRVIRPIKPDTPVRRVRRRPGPSSRLGSNGGRSGLRSWVGCARLPEVREGGLRHARVG